MWTQKLKIPGISANSQHPLQSLPFCRGHLLKHGKIWWKSCRGRQEWRTEAVSYLKGFMKMIFQLEVMIKSGMNPTRTLNDFYVSLSQFLSLSPPLPLSHCLSVPHCLSLSVCMSECVCSVTAAQMNSWKEIWLVFSSLVIILIHRKCLFQSAWAMWGTSLL